MKIKTLLVFVVFATISTSCKKQLEDKIYDKLTPSNALTNDQSAIAAVNSIYGALNGTGWDYYGGGNGRIQLEQDATTDEFASPSSSGQFWQLTNLVYQPDEYNIGINWTDMYKGISDANFVIQYLPPSAGVTASLKARIIAEAKTGLGLFYKDLVEMYGDVPLIKSYSEGVSAKPARTAANDVLNYAIANLKAAIPDLPTSYSSSDYGRFTKGAAQAILVKIYLMQKDWANVITYSDMIIPNYTLDASYSHLFSPTNQNDPEFILVKPSYPDFNVGNTYLTYSLPGDYQLPAGVNIQQWNNYRIRRSFYNTFDAADTRRALIADRYPNTNGGTTILSAPLDLLFMKYGFDTGANIVFAHNDIPIIRLADILLAKAEALNQVNGPTQDAIDLINKVRDRAFNNDITKRKKLSDFADKQTLDDYILQERGWELYFEGQRRVDLIRHGKFLTAAQARGALDVSQKRLYFPVPIAEINSNPNLVQTNGY